MMAHAVAVPGEVKRIRAIEKRGGGRGGTENGEEVKVTAKADQGNVETEINRMRRRTAVRILT
jgi:hypothetical protein